MLSNEGKRATVFVFPSFHFPRDHIYLWVQDQSNEVINPATNNILACHRAGSLSAHPQLLCTCQCVSTMLLSLFLRFVIVHWVYVLRFWPFGLLLVYFSQPDSI